MRLKAIAIALVLASGASLAAQQQSEDYAHGLVAGQRDARDNGVGVLSGVRLGRTRLVLSWVLGTAVPGGDLVGKSAEYVGGYMDEYKSKAKPRNFQYSRVAWSNWDDQDTKDCACGALQCVGTILFGILEAAGSVAGALSSCH
jgi:hypothetical protein